MNNKGVNEPPFDDYRDLLRWNIKNLEADKVKLREITADQLTKIERIEAELSRLKKEAEWKDGMLERAKSLITGTPAETPIEWMYELEKGPINE